MAINNDTVQDVTWQLFHVTVQDVTRQLIMIQCKMTGGN